jgi:hypothetical protein
MNLSNVEKVMTKDEVLSLLKTGTVKIRFLKANGDIRKMSATLSDSFIPPSTEKKVSPSVNANALPVWDIDADGWRSFRWDSLRMVNGMLTDGVLI